MTTRAMIGLALILATGCRADNPAYSQRGPAPATDAAPLDARAADLRATAPDAPGADRLAPADAAPAPDAPSAPPTAGLVGYWKLDDPPGSSRITDSSGQGNHGVAEGLTASAWVAGKVGTAVSFNPGRANPGIRIAASPSVDAITNRFSIAAWINGALTEPAFRAILSRQMGGGTQEHFNLTLHGAEVRLLLSTDTSGLHPYAAARVPLGQWVHVAGTYDGALLRVYVNGREAGSQARVASARPDTNPTYLGTNKNGSSVDETFQGALDEVALWSRTLTPAEVAALAAGAAPR